MDYKIEENIPLSGKGLTELTPEFKAISKLEPEESFEFPEGRRNQITTAIAKVKYTDPQKKFTVRKSNDLFSRVWRVK